MTAEYKIRTQVSEANASLAHITIRLEKHLFIDANSVETLKNVGDGVQGVSELLKVSDGVLKNLGIEDPKTFLLGLETDWQPLSEAGAEELLDRYYQVAPTFTASLQGGARDGSLLINLGKASMVTGLSKAQAQADKDTLERLAQYCHDHPPRTPNDVKNAVQGVVGVGVATTGIVAMGQTCLEGGVAAGLVGAAIGCIAGIVGALETFLGLVDAAEKQQEHDRDMRDRERVCGPQAGGPSDAMIDRMSRTC